MRLIIMTQNAQDLKSCKKKKKKKKKKVTCVHKKRPIAAVRYQIVKPKDPP